MKIVLVRYRDADHASDDLSAKNRVNDVISFVMIRDQLNAVLRVTDQEYRQIHRELLLRRFDDEMAIPPVLTDEGRARWLHL